MGKREVSEALTKGVVVTEQQNQASAPKGWDRGQEACDPRKPDCWTGNLCPGCTSLTGGVFCCPLPLKTAVMRYNLL